MGMNVEVTAIRYFVHVATAGSFVRGAERAHVSPPAVSKAIRKLEDDLGTPLFTRTTRRVQLTHAGQVALERCRRVLAELDGLDAEIVSASGQPTGTLRIAAMEVFSIEVLPIAVAQLVAAHPAVTPLCYEMIPQRMAARLLDGELDVGFTIASTPAEGIERHDLGSTPGVLVCGKSHPLHARGRVSPSDLQRYPSVVPRFFGAEHLPSLDQFPDTRYPRRVGATIELLQMGVELVAEGGYLGYFPAISVRRSLATKRLRALKGLAGRPPFRLHALSRAAVPLKPAAAALIMGVTTEIRRHTRA
ncbi:MAG: LysR family transcriptional regulator [Kofleriaceae bacterium]